MIEPIMILCLFLIICSIGCILSARSERIRLKKLQRNSEAAVKDHRLFLKENKKLLQQLSKLAKQVIFLEKKIKRWKRFDIDYKEIDPSVPVLTKDELLKIGNSYFDKNRASYEFFKFDRDFDASSLSKIDYSKVELKKIRASTDGLRFDAWLYVGPVLFSHEMDDRYLNELASTLLDRNPYG